MGCTMGRGFKLLPRVQLLHDVVERYKYSYNHLLVSKVHLSDIISYSAVQSHNDNSIHTFIVTTMSLILIMYTHSR